MGALWGVPGDRVVRWGIVMTTTLYHNNLSERSMASFMLCRGVPMPIDVKCWWVVGSMLMGREIYPVLGNSFDADKDGETKKTSTQKYKTQVGVAIVCICEY